MEIHEDAPVITRDEILIDADPESVWAIQTDFARWPDWQPGITAVKVDGGVAPGTTFRWSTDGLDIVSTVREVEAPRSIVWDGPADGVFAVHRWVLEPAGAGTSVRTEESWEGESVEADTAAMQAALNRSLRDWLQNLKAIAESPAMEGHS